MTPVCCRLLRGGWIVRLRARCRKDREQMPANEVYLVMIRADKYHIASVLPRAGIVAE